MTSFDLRWTILHNDLKQVTLSPDVVTLAIDELSRRLPLLINFLLLLLLDPRQPRRGERTNGIKAQFLGAGGVSGTCRRFKKLLDEERSIPRDRGRRRTPRASSAV